MAVGGGDLRAVGVVVHRRQGGRKPHTPAPRKAITPVPSAQRRGAVRMFPAAVHHVEGEQGHGEEGDRFEAEKIEEPLPELGVPIQ